MQMDIEWQRQSNMNKTILTLLDVMMHADR